MNFALIAIYVLSAAACIAIICEIVNSVGSTDTRWFGIRDGDSSFAVLFAGFCVFPVINTLLCVGFIIWLVGGIHDTK